LFFKVNELSGVMVKKMIKNMRLQRVFLPFSNQCGLSLVGREWESAESKRFAARKMQLSEWG